MLKKVLHIILTIVLWLGIVAYLVVASTQAVRKSAEIKVDSVRVVVTDGDRLTSVTEPMVRSLVARSGVKTIGENVGDVNTAELQRFVASQVLVKDARVYIDKSGLLSVEVSQHKPVARVKTSDGYDFYLTDEGCILPPAINYSVYVPLITGNLKFMMPVGYYGNYEQIKARLIDEYKLRMGELDSVLIVQHGDLTSLKKQRAEVRNQKAGRLWREERRKIFQKNQSEQLQNINNKIDRQEQLIAQTEKKRLMTVENQKKSAKRYLYLYKLLNFVKFVESDDFWRAQIVQINVVTSEGCEAPQVEIVPRAGRHVACLGEIEQAEKNLEKLMLFYRNALAWEGWDNYNYIDLRYEDQIVCSK
ncbi:MAG: hypothetical protein J6V43_03010 [Rikenellaceae bacterium]|nr:hypothetical protein [Rikenellaceae bacterium]